MPRARRRARARPQRAAPTDAAPLPTVARPIPRTPDTHVVPRYARPLPDTLVLPRYARPMRTGTALWRVTPALVLALDEGLGPPVDSYVNGSQTWFTGDDQTLEWRLHPIGGFSQPEGVMHDELWERVVTALTIGNPPEALDLGRSPVALSRLWD